MVLQDIAWHYMVLHGFAQYCMVLHGTAWCCIVLHGAAWYPTAGQMLWLGLLNLTSIVDSFISASKLRIEEEDLYFSLCHTHTRNLLPLTQTNGKGGSFLLLQVFNWSSQFSVPKWKKWVTANRSVVVKKFSNWKSSSLTLQVFPSLYWKCGRKNTRRRNMRICSNSKGPSIYYVIQIWGP